MSFWAKLFGRASPAPPDTTAEQGLSKTEIAARELLSNDANRQLVREALKRLEAAGLRIHPGLDRELIVVRFLRGFADCHHRELDKITDVFGEEASEDAKNSFDLTVLWDLASEGSAFHGSEDIDILPSHLSEMSDEALNDMFDKHSYSIFENAESICIVNEHGPGEYVRQHVGELFALTRGDFSIQSITASEKSDQLIGQVTLSEGQSCLFELIDEKRPDITPLFEAMNLLVAPTGKGRFSAVLSSNEEEVIVVYLRPKEQVAFRKWLGRQYCAIGSTPVDWLE